MHEEDVAVREWGEEGVWMTSQQVSGEAGAGTGKRDREGVGRRAIRVGRPRGEAYLCAPLRLGHRPDR